MPLYEYECAKCGKHYEKIEKYSGPHLKKCLNCGGRVERLLSAPAIQFKGSGWYVTDYAKKSGSGAEKKESSMNSEKAADKASDKAAGKTEIKSDGKPASSATSSEKAPEKKKAAAKEK